MKNKFNNDGAEYLDDLGRYRQTEQALEEYSKAKITADDYPFVVTTRLGMVYGPFITHKDARVWALSKMREFEITNLLKP